MLTHLLGVAALLIGPAGFWVAYHLYKDRHQPEPPLYLLGAFALGMAGGGLSLLAYESLDLFGLRLDAYDLARDGRLEALVVYSILAIGGIEEIAKFLPFVLLGIRHHHFDEPIDGIIYASLVALGYATLENALYLPGMSGPEAMGRAMALPMVHVLFASLWGHAAGWAHHHERPLAVPVSLALALAIVAHGLYDFLVIGFPKTLGIAAPLVVGAIWTWRLHLMRRLHLDHVRARLIGRLNELAHRGKDE